MNIEISEGERQVLLEALHFHELGLEGTKHVAAEDPTIDKIETMLELTGTAEYQLTHLRTLRDKLGGEQID